MEFLTVSNKATIFFISLHFFVIVQLKRVLFSRKKSFYRKKWRFFFHTGFSMEMFPWLGQLSESYILMKKWCDLLHENEFFPLKSGTIQSKITDSKPRWIYSAREKVMRRKRRREKNENFLNSKLLGSLLNVHNHTIQSKRDSRINEMWFLFVITF